MHSLLFPVFLRGTATRCPTARVQRELEVAPSPPCGDQPSLEQLLPTLPWRDGDESTLLDPHNIDVNSIHINRDLPSPPQIIVSTAEQATDEVRALSNRR